VSETPRPRRTFRLTSKSKNTHTHTLSSAPTHIFKRHPMLFAWKLTSVSIRKTPAWLYKLTSWLLILTFFFGCVFVSALIFEPNSLQKNSSCRDRGGKCCCYLEAAEKILLSAVGEKKFQNFRQQESFWSRSRVSKVVTLELILCNMGSRCNLDIPD
jgi:hypothetical protein